MKTISALLQNYLNGNRSSLQTGTGFVTCTPAVSPYAITTECWIKPLTLVNWNNLVANNWGPPGGWLLFFDASGNASWGVRDPVSSQVVSTVNGAVKANTLIHLVGTYDGANVKVYINGVPGPAVPLVKQILSTGSAITIGQSGLENMLETRIYNRAITDTEVAEHYAGVYKNESGRVLWLPYWDGVGTTVTDFSGYGNNGTLVSAPPWVPSDLAAADARQLRVCDLLTITPVGAAVVYYTNFDRDLVFNGHTFLSGNTKFRRSKTKLVAGVDVDNMDLELFGDSTNLIAGIGVLSACRAGLLDGARVSLDRLFMPDWGLTALGAINMFSGRVGTMQVSRSVANIKVVSDLVLLNIDMPRNVYQPGCRHALFDGGCTLNPATFTISGAVTAGSTANSVNTNLSQVNSYFTLGTMTFTSGVNNGLTRTIRQHTNAGGVMVPILPWPAAPATSDTFTALPGDDKQQSTCQNKFNNLVHFRAEPYVPVPETQI